MPHDAAALVKDGASVVDLRTPDGGIALRPYQREDVERIRKALRGPGLGVLYACPTGGGKSFVLVELARHFKRTAFATSRRHLMEDVVQRARARGIAVEYADRLKGGQWPDGARLLVGSATALNNRIGERFGRPPSAVLLDEAHHCATRDGHRRTNLWARLALRMQAAGAKVVGVTATPWRLEDDMGFDRIFGSLVVGPSYADLRRRGFVATIKVKRIGNLKTGALNTAGDYDEADVERLNEDRALYDDPLDALRAETGGWKRQSIVFSLFQPHARHFADRLAALPDAPRVGLMLSGAEYLAGAHPSIVTEGVVDAFKRGEIDVACSVGMLQEGLDTPRAEVGLMLRPTRSLAVWRQSCGRLSRVNDGGAPSVMLDAAGVTDELGSPTRAVKWSLLSRERDEAQQEAAQQADAATAALADACAEAEALRGEAAEADERAEEAEADARNVRQQAAEAEAAAIENARALRARGDKHLSEMLAAVAARDKMTKWGRDWQAHAGRLQKRLDAAAEAASDALNRAAAETEHAADLQKRLDAKPDAADVLRAMTDEDLDRELKRRRAYREWVDAGAECGEPKPCPCWPWERIAAPVACPPNQPVYAPVSGCRVAPAVGEVWRVRARHTGGGWRAWRVRVSAVREGPTFLGRQTDAPADEEES